MVPDKGWYQERKNYTSKETRNDTKKMKRNYTSIKGIAHKKEKRMRQENKKNDSLKRIRNYYSTGKEISCMK
jgi:hypothetical protein